MIENLINAAIFHDHNFYNVPTSKVLMVNSLINAIYNYRITFNIHISNNKREFTSLAGRILRRLKKLPPKLKKCQPLQFYEKVENLWRVRIYSHYVIINKLKIDFYYMDHTEFC